ncbi:MAG: carboxymuconolactone decarboxylase family protein [Leptospirales bacterium]
METKEKTTMDIKTKEMIALGVAYAINCKFCMEYHKKLAIQAGLSQTEMHAAIQVAEGVKSGASQKTQGYAKDLFGEVEEERCCPEGSECCP